jgi:Ca2+:H+ antiporter
VFTDFPELGRYQFFLGLVVLPVIMGTSDIAAVVAMARHGRADIDVAIAAGSSNQLLLLVVPTVALAGIVSGHSVSLIFSPIALLVNLFAIVAYGVIVRRGQLSRLEAAGLFAIWAAVAAMAALVPPA